MSKQVLIIDDEEKLRSLLQRIVSLEGFEVLTADTLHAAEKLLDKQPVNVVLCDVKLPDGNGVDFVATLKKKHPLTEIILLTAYGNIPDGIQAMKNGAFDYLVKGDDNDKLIPLLYRALEKSDLQLRVQQLEAQVGKKYSFDSIIGHSPVIEEAKRLAGKVAPTDATVLLLGETGVGKEVFAQAIHSASNRSSKPFVALNCSAFSATLLESELFGHKAGSFTGATKDKKGLMEEADKGTIFLDEIGEMQPDLQAKLLRVLETGEFIKVGDTKPVKVNVRIIAATNRALTEEIKAGHFREDLYYRLNVFAIALPALRERKEDIVLLAKYYMKSFAEKTNTKVNSMSKAFIDRLQQHAWKGNIRELKNVMERAVILADGNELDIYNLPFDMQDDLTPDTEQLDLASVEKQHIRKVLQHTKGNKTEAARLMNIGLTTLYRKLEEYGLAK